MFECPTCNRTFDSKNGLSVHHAHSHGESIAKKTSTCNTCGNTFEYYPSKSRTGSYCSVECNTEIPESSRSRGERYNSKKVECNNCGKEIIVQVSALREHNFCHRECYSEWKTVHEDYDGIYKGWYGVRKKAVERDGNECQRCGEDLEVDGRETTVHHVIPIRVFDDPSQAHFIENTVVMCRSCHRETDEHLRSISDKKLIKRLK